MNVGRIKTEPWNGSTLRDQRDEKESEKKKNTKNKSPEKKQVIQKQSHLDADGIKVSNTIGWLS